MKKIFFILIISFLFLSLAFITKAETSCDDSKWVECGGAAVCDDSECITECEYDWEWPHCDCKPEEEGGSECWCECNENCASEWCQKQNELMGYESGDELFIVKGRCDPDEVSSAQCCTAKEYSCGDGKDNDCDDKIDCADTDDCPNETVCDDNKVCKDKKCVEKVSVAVCPPALDCQQMAYACLCGEKETEVASGEFCFSSLSKKYELEIDCLIDKKPVCSEEPPRGEDCYCGSKVIEVDDEYYCFEKNIYTSEELYEEAKAGEPTPAGWIFTCKGKGITCPAGALCIDNPLCAESFEELINALINFIFYFSLVFAPIMFIIAGLLFVTAAGVPEKIQKAKNVMLWTAIGLAIIIMAKGIITVIQEIFQKVD